MKIASLSKVAGIIMLLSSAVAHSAGVLDVEYAPATNGNGSTFGVGYYQMKDDEIGFYGNLQSTLTHSDFYSNLTTTTYGDPVVGSRNDIFAGNVGVTKKLSDSFGAYAGVGYASVKGVAQMQDPMGILGTNGTYYVNNPQNDKSGINFNGGILVLLDRFALNLGFQSFTKSVYFGVGSSF